jgi:hypothetical protein
MSSLRKLPPLPVKSNISTNDTKQFSDIPKTTELPTLVFRRNSGSPRSTPRLEPDKSPTSRESNEKLDARTAVESSSPSTRTQSQIRHQDASPEPALVSSSSELNNSTPKVSLCKSEDSPTNRLANRPTRDRPQLNKQNKRLSIRESAPPQRPPPLTPYERFLTDLEKDLSNSPLPTTIEETKESATLSAQTLSSPRKSLGPQSRPQLLRVKTKSRPATIEQIDLSPTKFMSRSVATFEVISEFGIKTADRNSIEVDFSEKKEEN